MYGKCVCQLCTCGRHRCPHNRGTIGRTPIKVECDLETEYKKAYEAFHQQPRRQALRPAQAPHTSSVPMEMNTIYVQTFVPHELPTKIVRPPRKYVPTASPIDISSTYKSDFIAQDGHRTESYKPPNTLNRSMSKFGNETMYTMTYKEHAPDTWAWCRSSPIRPKENMTYGVDAFIDTSTMKEDFKKHDKPERAHLIRPKQESLGREPGKFVGASTYTVQFTEKERQTPDVRKPMEQYKPPTGGFQGTTTAMADYQAHPNHKPVDCYKPPTRYVATKAQFDGCSTFRDAYKEWPVQKPIKPAWAMKKVNGPSKDEFPRTSSYKDEFVRPANFERVKLAKPGKGEVTLSHGPQTSLESTQYAEQFRPPSEPTKRKSFKIIQMYEPPKESMVTSSTYDADFKGESVQAAQACHPPVRDTGNRRPFDHNSTYRDTYTGERPESCPASGLIDRESKVSQTEMFVHTGMVKGGHYYFVKKDSEKSVEPQQKEQISSSSKTTSSTANKTKSVSTNTRVAAPSKSAPNKKLTTSSSSSSKRIITSKVKPDKNQNTDFNKNQVKCNGTKEAILA